MTVGIIASTDVRQILATDTQIPLITSITYDQSQQVTVNWTAPTDDSFDGYLLRYRVQGSDSWDPSDEERPTGESFSIGNLTNGTTYQVQIGAVYPSGVVYSAIFGDVVPYGLPNVPVMTELVSEASGELTVRWTAPSSDGGRLVTEYKATTGVDAESCTSSATECTITNLINGTSYSVTVAAKNERGYGASSLSLSAPPFGLAGAPTGVSGEAQNQQVVVSWLAPASNGGSVVTGYVVTGSPSGTCSTSVLTCTVPGLTNGTSYTFTVKATNARGDSVASVASSAVIPRTTPGAPTSLVATAGDASASVAFTAPSSTGGADISNYEYSTDNGTSWKALSPADTTSPVSISVRSDSNAALVNGTVYQVKLRAVNTAGNGTDSDAVSVTPVASATVPGAPTITSVTSGNGQLSVNFTAPSSTGGAAVSNYQVSTDGGNSFTALVPASTDTPIVITGLTNGTSYSVRLKAVNSVGAGAASNSSSGTPAATVPGAPTNVVATAGAGQISLAFTAPSSNGGSPITNYEYMVGHDGWIARDPANVTSPIIVSGLSNGTSYDISLRAVNSSGGGQPSTVSVTPITTAEAPSTLVATPGDTQASIAFDIPWSNGGAEITNYEFSTDNGVTWKAFSPATTTTPVVITTRSDALAALTNGREYRIKMRAVNAVGRGAVSSSVAVTPRTTPEAPYWSAARAGNALVLISFKAPSSNGGSTITNYEYSTDNGASWKAFSPPVTSETLVITGRSDSEATLVNGVTYQVKMRAVNAAGPGASSSEMAVTPRTIANAPTSLVALPGDAQATVEFMAPISNGGAAITNYEYTTDNGASWKAFNPAIVSSPVVITTGSNSSLALGNGARYKIGLRAVNEYVERNKK